MEPRPDWIDPADAADPVTPSSMKEEIAAKTPSIIPLRAAKGNWTEFASILPTASIKLAVSTVLPHSLEFVRSFGFRKEKQRSPSDLRGRYPNTRVLTIPNYGRGGTCHPRSIDDIIGAKMMPAMTDLINPPISPSSTSATDPKLPIIHSHCQKDPRKLKLSIS